MHNRMLSLGILTLVVSLTLAFGAPVRQASAAETGTISGRVMRDLDQDGDATDTNEPGLAGWRLVLESDGADEPLREETRTDGEGRYTFDGLPPGDYDITLPCAGQPSIWGYSITEFMGYSVTLEPGGEEGDFNFPVIPIASAPNPPRTGSIAGRIVLDGDRDGAVRESDPGMAGWRLTAARADPAGSCSDEQPVATETDADGRFTFEHLSAGPYWVTPDSDRAPLKRWAVVSPNVAHEAGGQIWWPPETDVAEGAVANVTIGVASLEGTASISGSIYADLNRNGVRDPGEPVARSGCWMALAYRIPDGYVGVVPMLEGCEPDGVYTFSGLAPGDYMVGALYQFSPAVNPPAGPDTVSYLTVSLSEGEQRTGVDFGYESVPANLSEEPTPEPSPISPVTPDSGAATPVVPSLSSPSSGSSPNGSTGAPSTGSGGASPDHDGTLHAVLGLVAINAGVAIRLAFALRRPARRF